MPHFEKIKIICSVVRPGTGIRYSSSPPTTTTTLPPTPIGGGCWWKPPVYYNPVVHPLERGPDFSFLDGRRPAITNHWELERRKKQVHLGKTIVMYLSELKEAEELYKESNMHKVLRQEKIEQTMPEAKGDEEIF